MGEGSMQYTLSLSPCTIFKEITDARRIRNRILENLELATQPNTSEEERKRLLHFVVVGGGPTGVEFGAEFYDFLNQVHPCMVTSMYGHIHVWSHPCMVISMYGHIVTRT